MPETVKWFAWSKDERSGRWMVVNEGLKNDMRRYVTQMEQAAIKHDMKATFAALPEGTEPGA